MTERSKYLDDKESKNYETSENRSDIQDENIDRNQ